MLLMGSAALASNRVPDRRSAFPSPATTRVRRYDIDNLKVTLTVGVIVTHAILTYADLGSWHYQERNLGDFAAIALTIPVVIGALFAMGLFFLLAGLFTPAALQRKGTQRFIIDRCLRLGLPVIAYIVAVTPFVNLLVDKVQYRRPLTWGRWRYQVTRLDTGPVWFVAVLLLFSVLYACLRHFRPAHSSPVQSLRGRWLTALALVIGTASFLVRLKFAMNSTQVMNVHLFQWPQHICLFWLGVRASEARWLDPVAERMRRRCGWIASAGVACLPALMAVGGAFKEGATDRAFSGGWTWQSAGTALLEGALAVSFAIWLLGWFAARWNRTGPVAQRLAASAYQAFLLQTPVLVCLALVLRGLHVAPEVRLLILAPTSVAAAFGIAVLLRSSRVLFRAG
jgi:glucans biosynthesis protein C